MIKKFTSIFTIYEHELEYKENIINSKKLQVLDEIKSILFDGKSHIIAIILTENLHFEFNSNNIGYKIDVLLE